ncbi:hypothetical protein B0H10DRAFT_2426932 [Mycena sp. CBHHK59/15]|nr:hypothetical protein B0H10DRAFT_2426932 [Mycena sp. CBHHK59/15]
MGVLYQTRVIYLWGKSPARARPLAARRRWRARGGACPPAPNGSLPRLPHYSTQWRCKCPLDILIFFPLLFLGAFSSHLFLRRRSGSWVLLLLNPALLSPFLAFYGPFHFGTHVTSPPPTPAPPLGIATLGGPCCSLAPPPTLLGAVILTSTPLFPALPATRSRRSLPPPGTSHAVPPQRQTSHRRQVLPSRSSRRRYPPNAPPSRAFPAACSRRSLPPFTPPPAFLGAVTWPSTRPFPAVPTARPPPLAAPPRTMPHSPPFTPPL